MEAAPGDEMDAIDKVRQLLLANVYENRAADRIAKKEAVRQLLAPIMAARDAGMTYEDISRLFTQGGLALDAETLRKYFGEAKLASDLAIDARRHADQVAKARSLIARRRSTEAFEEADRVARERVAGRPQSGSAALAATSGGRGVEASSAVGQPGPKGSSRPAKVGPAPSPSASTTARAPTASAPTATTTTPAIAPRSSAPASAAAPSVGGARPPLPPGKARSIDEIERDSTSVDQRHVLAHDLEVRDGRVYLTTGIPYDGMLTRKQLHLLRQVGRLIAPLAGESSKSFVQMPERL